MYTRLFFTVNLDGTKVPTYLPASEYTSIRYLSRYMPWQTQSVMTPFSACVLFAQEGLIKSPCQCTSSDEGEQHQQPQQAETSHTPLQRESCGMNNMHVRMLHTRKKVRTPPRAL